MLDARGRTINYLRLSVTDRCNLRCAYCMPRGIHALRHEEILSYEELLSVCAQAVALGIDRFKVTGGEPLVRKGCVGFIARLKALPGVKQVTLTTNGLLLGDALDELAALPIDGVNISLDTLDPACYARLTGADEAASARVLAAVERCAALGLRTKLNAVLAEAAFGTLPDVLRIAERLAVDVRLIELMPIGEGGRLPGVSAERALALCRRLYPDLHAVSERRGNGPARYFASEALQGRIGLIDAVSQPFCASCNRARLTSTGVLKPCLCYDSGVALRPLLRGGAGEEALRDTMRSALFNKPAKHCFSNPDGVTEHAAMNEIGG